MNKGNQTNHPLVLPISEHTRRQKIALANLLPLAKGRVKDALDTEKNPDDARLAFDAARWVIEMKDGKPRQQVDTNLSGELVIRVVYEKPPEKTE